MVPIAWSTRAVVRILEERLQVLPSALGSPPWLSPTRQLDLNRRWPFTEPTMRSNILEGARLAHIQVILWIAGQKGGDLSLRIPLPWK
jgi:hypothetical protein